MNLWVNDVSIGKDKGLNEEYVARINKVQDYIECNISEEFSLETLAKEANFSPYHFHRIFSAYTGEPLYKYVLRVRLEKAAFLLISNFKKPISEIALDCGFSNQASFSRAFKKHFGSSAGEFRNKIYTKNSKECKTESNIRQVLYDDVIYNINNINNTPGQITAKTRDIIPVDIGVKQIQPMYVAYIRHTGPYKRDAELFSRLFGKLYKWAAARDLVDLPDARWLTIYHNEPEVTRDEKLRISVSITVPESIKPDGEMGAMIVQGGKYAIARFSLQSHQYQSAWDYLCGSWLPESGYQPDDRCSFELYPHMQEQSEDGSHIVDIYLPVKPL
jgi:AraC family transcriptional regulator